MKTHALQMGITLTAILTLFSISLFAQTVGIGQASFVPATLLHMQNTAAATDAIFRIENTLAGQKSGINFLNSGTANASWLFYVPASSTNLRLQTQGLTDILTIYNTGDALVNNASFYGNIGINQAGANNLYGINITGAASGWHGVHSDLTGKTTNYSYYASSSFDVASASNYTKYGLYADMAAINSSTGGINNYGIYSYAHGSGGSGTNTNIGGYFSATSGTNNYAIIVPSGGGNVGIGTITPNGSALLHMGAALSGGAGADTKGMLTPRVTLSATNSTSPVLPAPGATENGLIVYNTATAGSSPNNVTPGFYYWNGTKWIAMGGSGGNDWSLLGNAGTVDGTNFLGTTDNIPFNIEVNSQKSGRIDQNGPTFFGYQAGNNNTNNASSFCTGIGFQALQTNTTGSANTATGYWALYTNTTGNENTANGVSALYANTIGLDNTAVGYGALIYNTNAGENVAIGSGALWTQSYNGGNAATTWGSYNVAIGKGALYSNQPTSTGNGVANTAIGWHALYANTTGWYNTAVGGGAMIDMVSGQQNTACGLNSLYYATAGYNNTALGCYAGFGVAGSSTGVNNTALGTQALFHYTTGFNNTAAGANALYFNSTGYDNVAIGREALDSNYTGNYNTALGTQSLFWNSGTGSTAVGYEALFTNSNKTGTYNTAIGYGADISGSGLTNATAIGNLAYVGQSNSLVLGSINGVNGATANTNVGIGTTTPGEILEVYTADATIRVRNSNDAGGGFIGDTWSAVQLGMYNPTGSTWGVVTAGQKRSFFGFNDNGLVGSITTAYGNPTFRNVLDDGNGKCGIGITTPQSILHVHNSTAAGQLFQLSNLNTSGGNTPTASSGFTISIDASENVTLNQFENANMIFKINNVQSGLLTNGTKNAAWGYNSLSSASLSGSNNTANGNQSLLSNTTGSFNTAIGSAALQNNTSLLNNTAIGYMALFTQSYNPGNNTTQSDNVAVGYQALEMNNPIVAGSSGNNNTAIGDYSLANNTTGYGNTAVGTTALQSNTTGWYNTAVGIAAYQAGTYTWCTGLGANAIAFTASGQVHIGDAANVSSIGGRVAWSVISDARFKKDVEENVPGLAFITKLRPVTYHMNMDVFNSFLHTPDRFRSKEKEAERSQEIRTGFIAQEVEKAAQQVGFDFDGVEKPQNENDYYSLRYSEFVVPLVKAVQELNDSLKLNVQSLKLENAKLKTENDELKAQFNAKIESQQADIEKIKKQLGMPVSPSGWEVKK
jgi:hypothetical protein